MTLLGVNDLQKYNTNNKATFYILFCCRCWSSCRCRCLWEEGREKWWMIDEVCIVCLRRRQRQCDDDDDGRWLQRLHLPPTDNGNDNGRVIYIGSKVRIVHTTNSMFLRIFRTRFQRLEQAKQRERETGRAERAVQPFGTWIWILNFLRGNTTSNRTLYTPTNKQRAQQHDRHNPLF